MKKPIAILALFSLSCVPAFSETLRVMSFNIRYPAKSDGPNLWDLRKDLVVRMIRKEDPDVFGTQELFAEQGRYIVEKAPEYTWFGLSRRGNHEDEHMGVFYKKSKLKLIESGNFWLSKTPEIAGSMSWDVTLPRMVTWGMFETDEGKRFYFYDTHFPHRPQDEAARIESAKVIRSRIEGLPADVPFIMTGDYNSAAGSGAYQVFQGLLTDSRLAAEKTAGPEGTFNGFRGRSDGPRIDWILYRGRNVRALSNETVSYNEDGHYPSDHFPVIAVIEIP